MILVTSCQSLTDNGVTVLFTDRHAYAATAAWSADLNGLAATIDGGILCRHDFGRSDSYPDKKEPIRRRRLLTAMFRRRRCLRSGAFRRG